jgi:Arc/MetJ family transcription regulator
MRVHITLDDVLVDELDQRVGVRRRSRFISECLRRVLDDERRWDDIEAGLGTIEDRGHEWDQDPQAWVEAQRSSDQRRVG